jgi:hypothetical protein
LQEQFHKQRVRRVLAPRHSLHLSFWRLALCTFTPCAFIPSLLRTLHFAHFPLILIEYLMLSPSFERAPNPSFVSHPSFTNTLWCLPHLCLGPCPSTVLIAITPVTTFCVQQLSLGTKPYRSLCKHSYPTSHAKRLDPGFVSKTTTKTTLKAPPPPLGQPMLEAGCYL